MKVDAGSNYGEPIDLIFDCTSEFTAGFNAGVNGIGEKHVKYASTEYWNTHPTIVSMKGTIYIYSDYSKDPEGRDIAAFKVGDGNAYLIDLPFSTSGNNVYYNTSAYWSEHDRVISNAGVLYIYSDARTIEGVTYPDFKIGDGNSYIIDLPFFDKVFYDHIQDQVRHITQQEREFWNRKERCYVDNKDPEAIIFTNQ